MNHFWPIKDIDDNKIIISCKFEVKMKTIILLVCIGFVALGSGEEVPKDPLPRCYCNDPINFPNLCYCDTNGYQVYLNTRITFQTDQNVSIYRFAVLDMLIAVRAA